MAELLRGKPVADAITAALQAETKQLMDQGICPKLAIVRVGERPDDISYERGAKKRCESIGIAVHSLVLPEQATGQQLLDVLTLANQESSVHGILVLRPLPKHMDEAAIIAAVAPEKDVDGVTPGSMAAVYAGSGAGFPPCTAQACMEILDHYGIDLTGKTVAVMGRSTVIGKPAAMLAMGRNATVTICHTRTKDAAAVCRKADVLVAAVGRAGMIDKDYVAPGQVVLDVGIHVGPDGALCGDVDFAAVEPVVGAITPVPGGVGSVTTAVLAKHVVAAARRQKERQV